MDSKQVTKLSENEADLLPKSYKHQLTTHLWRVQLPDELLFAIFELLSDETLRHQITRVNKKWYEIALNVYNSEHRRLAFYQMAFAKSTLWQHLTTIAEDGSLVDYYSSFFPQDILPLHGLRPDRLPYFLDDMPNNDFFKITNFLSKVFNFGKYKRFKNTIFRELREAQALVTSGIESPSTFGSQITYFFTDFLVSQDQKDFSVAEFVRAEAKWLKEILGTQTVSKALGHESAFDIEVKLSIARRYRRLEALFYFPLFLSKWEHWMISRGKYVADDESESCYFSASRFNFWFTTADLIGLVSAQYDKDISKIIKWLPSESPRRALFLENSKNILEQIMVKVMKAQIDIRLHLFHRQKIIKSQESSALDLEVYQTQMLSNAGIPECDISIEQALGKKASLTPSERQIIGLSTASAEKLLYTLNLFNPQYLDSKIAENLLLLNAHKNLLGKLNQRQLLILLEQSKQSKYQKQINQRVVLSAMEICQAWPFSFGERSIYEWSDEQIVELLALEILSERNRKNSFAVPFLVFKYLLVIGRVNLSLIENLKKALVSYLTGSNQIIYLSYGKELLIRYVLKIQQKGLDVKGGRCLIKDASLAFALMSLLLEEPTSEFIGEISLKDTLLIFPEITQNFTAAQLINLRAIANQSPYWQKQDLSLFEQLIVIRLSNKTTDNTRFLEDVIAYLPVGLLSNEAIERLCQKDIWRELVQHKMISKIFSSLIHASFFVSLKNFHLIELASAIFKSLPLLLNDLSAPKRLAFIAQLHTALCQMEFCEGVFKALITHQQNDAPLSLPDSTYIGLIAYQSPEQTLVWLKQFLSHPEAIKLIPSLLKQLVNLAKEQQQWHFIESALTISADDVVLAYLRKETQRCFELTECFIKEICVAHPKKRGVLNTHPLFKSAELVKLYTFEQLRALCIAIPETERGNVDSWFPGLYQEIFICRIIELSETELQILKSIFLKAPNQFLFFSCEAIRVVDQEYERREQLKIDKVSIEQQQNGVINMSKWYRPSRIKLPFTVRFVLATLAGFLFCFGLSALMPWLAIPAVVFSIAALCGGTCHRDAISTKSI